MAKTTKPISVLVIGMEPTPALEQLVADGHSVEYSIDGPQPPVDMILGPRCWRYLPDISEHWIKLIVKEARAAQPVRAKKVKKK